MRKKRTKCERIATLRRKLRNFFRIRENSFYFNNI